MKLTRPFGPPPPVVDMTPIPEHLVTRKESSKCLTPGAEYRFYVDQQSVLNGFHHIKFAVDFIPAETMRKITRAKAEALENAFHDAIEKVLAPIWTQRSKP